MYPYPEPGSPLPEEVWETRPAETVEERRKESEQGGISSPREWEEHPERVLPLPLSLHTDYPRGRDLHMPVVAIQELRIASRDARLHPSVPLTSIRCARSSSIIKRIQLLRCNFNAQSRGRKRILEETCPAHKRRRKRYRRDTKLLTPILKLLVKFPMLFIAMSPPTDCD
ncbi:hypothetical protein KM043_017265 [Ampulex compressa]|nr:hypothetical protein KM043_017265 [Ampulex compressa]